MTSFFQSKLYAHFWLFILKSSFMVGLFSLVGVLAQAGVAIGKVTSPSSDGMSFAFIVFFVGALFGFLASIAGYLVLFTALKLKLKASFPLIAAVVGAALGLGVLIYFYRGNNNLIAPNSSVFLFPVAPLLASVYTFVRLSQKHIQPYV